MESWCVSQPSKDLYIALEKFPEHFSKLQVERVDKATLDALSDSAEVHLQSLEPWVQVRG